MKIISKIIGYIDDEIDDAEKYAKCALEYKSEHPKLASKLHDLSEEEMDHMKQLHSEVVRLIDDYRNKNGEPPAEMLAIYNYEHKKQINRAAFVKQLIEEYEM